MVVKEGVLKREIVGMMGKQKMACCLSLVLLVLLILPLKTVDGQGRFNRFRSGSASPSSSSEEIRTQGFFQRGEQKNEHGGDDLFGVEKRRVHTGPNPLHNR